MGILRILLYFVIVFLPMGVVVRIPVFESVFIYPIDIAVGTIFVLTLYYTRKNKIKLHAIHKALLLFAAVCAISLIMNVVWLGFQTTLISSLYLLRLIAYGALTVSFQLFEPTFSKKYLLYLTLSGIILVIFGLLQYFLYPYLGNLYYEGWDEHYYRVFSTLFDPNFMGAMIILLLITLFFTGMNVQSKKVKSFHIAAYIPTIVALLLTYSRNAYVMFVTVVITYLLLQRKFLILIVLILLFLVGVWLIPKDRQSEGVDLLRTTSTVNRIENMQKSITIISRHLIFGVGFNSYRYAQQKEGLYERPRSFVEYDNSAAGVSNSYLFVLATTGIIGFGVFLYVLYVIIVSALSKMRSEKVISNIVLFSTFAIGIGSLLENLYFYQFIMIWYFSMIGLFIALTKNTKTKESR